MPLTIDTEPGTVILIRNQGQEIAIKLDNSGGQIRATILEPIAGVVLVEEPAKASPWSQRVGLTPKGEAYSRQIKTKSAVSR